MAVLCPNYTHSNANSLTAQERKKRMGQGGIAINGPGVFPCKCAAVHGVLAPAEGGRAEPGRHSPPLRSSHPSPTALEIMHPDTGEGRAHAPVGPPVVAALPAPP